MTERRRYEAPPELYAALETVKERIRAVFFVPTKYRVYRDLLDSPPAEPLPDAQWEYVRELARRLDAPAVNLTGRLQERSALLLDEGGGMTYWADDTHWNRLGVETAAAVVAETLSAAGGGRTVPETERGTGAVAVPEGGR